MEKQAKAEKKRKHGKDKKDKKERHRGEGDKKDKEGEQREKPKVIKTGYGLVYPKGVPTDKKEKSDAPKAELKDFETIKKEKRMEKHKEWEERDKEAQRKRDDRRKRQQSFRGLSSEEKKRKLEEMQSDAAVNEQRRDNRLKRHRAAEDKKDEADVRSGDIAANFLKYALLTITVVHWANIDPFFFFSDLKKKTYSKAGVATLEDRLTRNAHFRYKGDLEEADTFKTK